MIRRGSIYLMVLLTSAFVLASGLIAITLEQRTHERVSLSADVAASRIAARAGLDFAMQYMVDNPSWRNRVGLSDLLLTMTINTGQQDHAVSVYAMDPDGNLAQNTTDPFILTVKSKQGNTSRQLRVTLLPGAIPMDVLELGAYSRGNVVVQSGAQILGTAPLSTNNSISGKGAIFSVPVEAVGSTTGSTFLSDIVQSASQREVPSSLVIFQYKLFGTFIQKADLPQALGVCTLDQIVLGPGLNPFGTGATNSSGVYVIDQGGADVVIRNSRILGTLVFIGSGSVILEGSVNLSPATTGWPVLMNSGPILFRTSSTPLSESSLMTNFNPIGLGGGGVEDLDQSDVYPSEARGIVYSRSSITIESGETSISGTMISANSIIINSTATLNLTSSRDSLDHPPPGFESRLGLQMSAVQWLNP